MTIVFNGNRSSLHWDLVLMQDKAAGGGEIWPRRQTRAERWKVRAR